MAKMLGLTVVFAIKTAKVKTKITETRVLLRELKEITSFVTLDVVKKRTPYGMFFILGHVIRACNVLFVF